MPLSHAENSITPEAWPEALATVLSCKYDFGAGRALVGIPTTKHFRITYNYWAPNEAGTDELHTGEFVSDRYLAQNTLFPIRYNPDAPHDHLHAYSSVTVSSPRNTLIILGVAGSLILSLAWLVFLRSCH
jgi:hypothetical protein